ncbi:MAG: FAD-dependent oxidoreductase [Pelagibacteraceae bacterium]
MKLIKYTATNYSNFKSSISKIYYPKNNKDLIRVINYAKKRKLKILSLGSSLSWYDTIFNTNNIIVNLSKYKKIFKFNKLSGIITVSSYYKINDILRSVNKFGWTIQSIPGNAEVTIGGCVGNDVHGKDSFKSGNFGASIIELEIILANKKKIICSKNKNSKIFKAVVGGLGLIGIITKVKLKLKKIKKNYITYNFVCKNHKEIVKEIYKTKNYEYVYGWLDMCSKNDKIGRGVIFKSRGLENSKIKISSNKFLTSIKNLVKSLIFAFCIKNKLIKQLNYFFYKSFLFKKKSFVCDYKKICYPLEENGINFKSIISPASFLEIQLIIKKNNLSNGLKKLIEKCHELKIDPCITGIKVHAKNSNYLSFSDNGVSINITHPFNFKNKKEIFKKFKLLHEYVIQKNYKTYIAKDFFLDKKTFFKNYYFSKKFIKVKKDVDSSDLFYSDFFRRIKK